MRYKSVDFQRVIKDLEKTGWSQTAIGLQVGLPQTVISRMKCRPGSEPRYNAGARLVALHKRATQ